MTSRSLSLHACPCVALLSEVNKQIGLLSGNHYVKGLGWVLGGRVGVGLTWGLGQVWDRFRLVLLLNIISNPAGTNSINNAAPFRGHTWATKSPRVVENWGDKLC